MTTFEARVSTTDDGLPLLAVSGDVDVASADNLIVSAFDVVGGGRALVLDLGKVTFMDSTGLSALLRIRTHLTERGGDLTVATVSRAVRRVFELVGMLDVFGVDTEPSP